MLFLRTNAVTLLILCSALSPVQTAQAEANRWMGTLSFALLRSTPVPPEDFHDRLSTTLAGFWSVSPAFSIGPEIGYHGVETISLIQCGPEWGVDCPSPDQLRVGTWEAAALARWQTSLVGARPYLVAGGGAYSAGNYVVELREAKIDRRMEPGVTAGAGVRFGLLGVEGRWHYISNGVAEGRYDGLEDNFTYSYSPLRIYSASLSIHIP